MKRSEIKNNDSLALKGRGSQSGRSMIEMLGVLAIIGVLSVGGIAGYSKAMQKYRINKTIEQISQISQNIRTFFAPQRSYEGLNNSDVIKKAKIVPEEMWDGDKLKGAFNTVFVNNPRSTNSYFEIGFNNIPQEVCIELMSLDWSTVSSGFQGIANNGLDLAGEDCWMHNTSVEGCSESSSEGYGLFYVNGTIGIPVPLDIATTVCSETNYIGLLFK
ncbi:MAG: hypothetical protein IKO06_05465 [Alphaproteobacteria bacterium]|nr:hypothetical protein [Alphaproteobacteria bacterium]